MLIDLVRRAAREAPGQPALISSGVTMSYADWLVRGEAVAHGLRRARIERFGCALRAPSDTFAALAGASAAGAEACVYPADLDATGLAALARALGHHVVLAEDGSSLGEPRLVPFVDLQNVRGSRLRDPDRAPVMILTTGTTGEQKGVRHDWRRLVHGVRHPDERPGTRWLLAYNLNQFAGIQVLIHAVASRATVVSPESRRVNDVIEAIRTHAVTHVSATPTFWRILAGRIDSGRAAGLPLRQITLGGEAAPQSLLDRLQRLFPDARVSHVYAATELGSVVAVRDGRSGLPLSVLERDENADVQLRVLDGELQARSRVGMLGYHDQPDDDWGWRRTGDLVEVGPDRIQFVGRTSEIINVGGAKVHPLPLEELICSVPGVHLASVYGRPNAVTGQIVAVDVVPSPDADPSDLRARIHRACEQLPPAGRPRLVRVVPAIEMRGNKLLRREARAGA